MDIEYKNFNNNMHNMYGFLNNNLINDFSLLKFKVKILFDVFCNLLNQNNWINAINENINNKEAKLIEIIGVINAQNTALIVYPIKVDVKFDNRSIVLVYFNDDFVKQ